MEDDLGVPLTIRPDLALDPWISALVFAKYFKNRESSLRGAFNRNDLKRARILINGKNKNGEPNGFTWFQQSFDLGRAFLLQHITGDVNRQYMANAIPE